MLILFADVSPWSVPQVTAANRKVLENAAPDDHLSDVGVTAGEFALQRLHCLVSHTKSQTLMTQRIAPELMMITAAASSPTLSTPVSPEERERIELDIAQNRKRHQRRMGRGGLTPSPLLPHLSLASVTAYLFLIRGASELDTEHLLAHGQTVAAFATEYLRADLQKGAESRQRAKLKQLAQKQASTTTTTTIQQNTLLQSSLSEEITEK
jgi:hypothetical protein